MGLARALAADPPIILLDEPFGALDPLTRTSIRREFRELEELKNKTVVLVTHDVIEAFELADRIMLLEAGQVQQLGTPRELLFRPANDFVRRFFAEERLGLQLRTLTLGDVWGEAPPERGAKNPERQAANPEFRGWTPERGAKNPERQATNPEFRGWTPERGAKNPERQAANPERGAKNPERQAANPEREAKSPEPRVFRLERQGQTPEFGNQTTVHDALEALTGAIPVPAPFTVAQLMAAFGEALQREEDAWKR